MPRLELGVNIDHVATLRQARYSTMPEAHNVEPDLIAAASLCERAGARGITIHLRADRRHIQDRDVFRLRESIMTKLNLEMGNTPEILAIALRVLPEDVCIVPENRREITTEGGLDAVRGYKQLEPTIRRLQSAGIRVSLFIEPDPEQIEAARGLGVEAIELHTGAFANATGEDKDGELKRLIGASCFATDRALQVNAGHGINYINIARILEIPRLRELNIGHAIVSRALFIGLQAAVAEMVDAIRHYPATMSSFDLAPGTRVAGIGVDIVETARILHSIERFGDRFLNRVFTQGERDYCGSMPHPARHYGARFAAKEAVSKAFGTGIGKQIGWRDIEVKRKESGEPYILLHGSAATLAASTGILQAMVSLSHSDNYSVASAILIAKA